MPGFQISVRVESLRGAEVHRSGSTDLCPSVGADVYRPGSTDLCPSVEQMSGSTDLCLSVHVEQRSIGLAPQISVRVK